MIELRARERKKKEEKKRKKTDLAAAKRDPRSSPVTAKNADAVFPLCHAMTVCCVFIPLPIHPSFILITLLQHPHHLSLHPS